MTAPGRCDGCPQEIVWAVTRDNKKRMPLNAGQDEAGNVAAYVDHTGRLVARVLRKNEVPEGFERRYMPHFATCPAWQRRSRPEGRAQVVSLDSRRGRSA